MITELIVGGLIVHTVPVKNIETVSFKPNVIAKIDNFNLLVGANSIGKFIYGAGYDFKIVDNINFKLGGYIQDEHEFHKKQVDLIFADFMPIAGFELNFNINSHIDFTSIVTLPMTFFGLKVKF